MLNPYAKTLNGLNEMIESKVYAARYDILSEAENIIVHLMGENERLKKLLENNVKFDKVTPVDPNQWAFENNLESY